ncbi:MAG: division/cell wall cluster transcriptional repressor MraZ [Planctomycetes bacterium]|nr:division/cell wall cluster transcriptional repressor MraZ [Planctomycetota bacterium]
MTLTGTYPRSLDEKQRLAVPKRLREQFGDESLKSLFVTPETDHSLGLYSPAAFEALATRLGQRSANPAQLRNYLRLFYARAERLDVDSQGRIRIPERLMEFAKLQRDVVLLGVHDHAEIWDAGQWEQFLGQHGPEFDSMARHAFE